MATPTNRRTFFRQLGGLTIGLAFVPLVGCEDNLVEPLVDGTDIPFLTPNEDFFVQFGAQGAIPNWPGVQQISQGDWQLVIDGLVDTPLTLSFADLEAEQDAEVNVLKTMRCIIDTAFVPGLIGTAVWTGVPLRRLLDRAGVDLNQTSRLRIYGSDGFTNNLRLDQVFGDVTGDAYEPLLVYAMNGQPLTADHGAPVRLLIHDLYGYKNVKWVERIEAVASDDVFGTYQEVFGFTDDAEVRIINKVTNPLSGQPISAGPFRIFGYALSGAAGVEQVEVTIDDGPVQQARIVPLAEVLSANPILRDTLQASDLDRFPYPFRNVWTLWELDWDATPGNHTIEVRATDRAGNSQPDTDTDPRDGNNPVFRVTVDV